MSFMDDQVLPYSGDNGKSVILNPDEPFITEQLNKDIWKLRINKMVKAAKETLTSTWAAPVILAVLLGFVIYDRTSTNASFAKQLQEQHDLLIKLETLHEVEEKEQTQAKIEKKLDDDKEQIRREKENTRVGVLEALLGTKIPKNN